MDKITDIIENPGTVDPADLPLDDLVDCLRAIGVAARIEVARPVRQPGFPEPDHLMVLEAWFTDLERARALPEHPEFERLDDVAARIHRAVGIRRHFSEVD